MLNGLEMNFAVVDGNFDSRIKLLRKSAFRTFNGNETVFDLGLYTFAQNDWDLSNS